MGSAARFAERQVTYPLSTALLWAPRVRSTRGFTDAGFALIYVLFEDGTDLYWARSRVAELLSKAASTQVRIDPPIHRYVQVGAGAR